MARLGRLFGLGLFLAVAGGGQAWAEPPFSLAVLTPLQLSLGAAELDLGGTGGAALFTPGQDSVRGAHASGVVKAMPRLHRDYDSGLSLGLNATLTAADVLSRGRYGGDFFEKVYGEARTGLGRIEIGQTDGAGYDLAVGGPKVDAAVSLDDAQTTFFRDPVTGRAVSDIFALRTEVGASSNYAELAYVSPALLGAQLALSFAPGEGKEVLPFAHAGPHVAGRQADIWEAALRYSDSLGPVALSVYGGAAVGRAEHKLGGQEGVSDWGLGARADYSVNDDWAVALGGAWRQSNAYAFDINRSYQAGDTSAFHASAEATDDAFSFGIEYGGGEAKSVAGLSRVALHGYQISLGYDLSPNIKLSTGWQKLDYGRGAGLFYNGAARLAMDAIFLHLNLHV